MGSKMREMNVFAIMVMFLVGMSMWVAAQLPKTIDVSFPPVDEGVAVPDFDAFRKLLSQAIKDKDEAFLLEHADESISFGGKYEDEELAKKNSGKKAFQDILQSPKGKWALEVLAKNIRLGGTWGDRRWGFKDKEHFCANYVHMCWPEDRVSLRTTREFLAVTGDKVNVRSGPGVSYDVVATISYQIVEFIGESAHMLADVPEFRDTVGGESYPWFPVRLQSGIEGYIFGLYVEIPSYGTPMVVFKKVEGVWKIVYLHLSS
jgi:hypothetical protein